MAQLTTHPSPSAKVAVSPSLQRACHYSRYKFFKFRPEKGQIFDWNHQQNLLATEDFIVALQKGLEHEVGEASGWLVYLIGKNWGTEDAKLFQSWFQKDFGMTLKTANLRFALETWWWPFTAQGWGKWNVDLNSVKEGFIFVDLFDSAVAKTLGNVGKPVCFLYAGVLAGFFSVAFERNLSGIEIQCYSMGNSFCRFLISSEKRVKAAEFWLTSGATAQDIEQRFHKKDFATGSGA
jgi:predicted hydrocarbon binding protein